MDQPEVQLELGLVRSPARRRSSRGIPSFRIQIVSLVCEGSAPFAHRRLRGSVDVYNAFRDTCDTADREYFWTVLLDNKHAIIGIEQVSQGSLTASIVHPREVFKAVVLANAAAIILVHNHPSGDPTPSAEDLEITRRLREVGELFGIRVLDHLVIGRGRYVSFVDDGYW
ncbi:MAG: JAB domain-containing protein [Mycobacterium sp.]